MTTNRRVKKHVGDSICRNFLKRDLEMTTQIVHLLPKTKVAKPFTAFVCTANTSSAADSSPTDYDEALVHIDITAISGTSPTLTVFYESSLDGGSTWNTRASTAALSAVGITTLALPDNIGITSRILLEVGGTSPSITLTAWVVYKRNGM